MPPLNCQQSKADPQKRTHRHQSRFNQKRKERKEKKRKKERRNDDQDKRQQQTKHKARKLKAVPCAQTHKPHRLQHIRHTPNTHSNTRTHTHAQKAQLPIAYSAEDNEAECKSGCEGEALPIQCACEANAGRPCNDCQHHLCNAAMTSVAVQQPHCSQRRRLGSNRHRCCARREKCVCGGGRRNGRRRWGEVQANQ